MFDAKEKSGSFAWKSILGARRVISLGAKWRIGDGFTARIYKDNWLPKVGDGKVVSPIQFLHEDCIVVDLLDEDSGWWNSQLLDQVFLAFNVEKIKSIPLSTISQPNFLYWPNSTHGVYKVKLGYKLLCEVENNELATSSNLDRSK